MCLLNYPRTSYHRYLLDKLLVQKSKLICGEILDIGSRNRRYDALFEGNVTAADIVHNHEKNVSREDITELSYVDRHFDSVVCIEVLPYLTLNGFNKALSEIHRVLKIGGTAIITSAYGCRDHGDNVRVSAKYFDNLVTKAGFEECNIYKLGNKFTSVFDAIRGAYNEKLISAGFCKKILLKFIYSSLFLFYYVKIRLFNLEKVEDDFYSGVFAIVKRNS